jgi:hypothetical protein
VSDTNVVIIGGSLAGLRPDAVGGAMNNWNTSKRLLVRGTGVLGAALVAGSVATATPLPVEYTADPLHGYCAGAGHCVDNGAISPTTNNPLTGFGFTVSPGPQTGDLLIDILIPDNEVTAAQKAAGFAVTGTGQLNGTAIADNGVAALVSPLAWESGTLPDFLTAAGALNGQPSPANPIGAYLNNQVTLAANVDPGATGYFVFQVDLGQNTLQDPSNPGVNPLETVNWLPLGSVILGFLDTGSSIIATANSGAIVVDPTAPPPVVPEPGSMVLLATGFIGAARVLRRKR